MGISLIPTSYGISFPISFLNASSSYVRIYLDGSVLVSHSATGKSEKMVLNELSTFLEMGQGVNIKMMQIASQELGVDIAMVKIRQNSSSEIPNRYCWSFFFVCFSCFLFFFSSVLQQQLQLDQIFQEQLF